ncbi:MAG: hypothetical protein ACI9FN_000635, partial [Saprospiraceae bacterium]
MRILSLGLMDGKQLLLIPLLFIGIVIGHAQPTSEFEG